ncbi:class I SAM-dependent methyltransferase [Oleiharenicola sp. Vm1]|uniref:class I SAM-dependent methyltransferase n=1 Tax=Oleiharenicola sp. Vm1 TaxID=3398393 RepID=UPI0039F524EA
MSAQGLGQYMTPAFAGELLVERMSLAAHERVVEFSCGDGRGFLRAIPPPIEQVVGIEIDPALAAQAIKNSGRPVITGDFRTVALPFEPTLFIGNPPFSRRLVDQFLRRMHRELNEGGRAAMILPAYHFQWARPTLQWAEMFSIEQQMIPRELFPGLMRPLNWVVFTKERQRRLFGFLIYPETAEVKGMSPGAKLLLVQGRPRQSVWGAVVDAAIEAAGGDAELDQIYHFVCPRRPTGNPNWKQQVRKVLYLGDYADHGGRWRKTAA